MTPDLRRALPPSMQIARQLREKILSGELADGDPVPSVSQIQRDCDVARATALKAIKVLQAEGLVVSLPGKGTIVSIRQTGHTSRDRFAKARASGAMYPTTQFSLITAAELVDADEAIAAALHIEPGDQVVRRHRITTEKDVPIQCSTSWYPKRFADAVPELLNTERMAGGTVRHIEERLELQSVMGCEQYTAAGATADEARELNVLEGSPVLSGENWLFDANGDVIEFGQSASIPGRKQSYEFRLD